MNDIVTSARRLLDALDSLFDGSPEDGFGDWENGYGEQVGHEIEDARKALEEALCFHEAKKPKQHCSGFWNEAFGDES